MFWPLLGIINSKISSADTMQWHSTFLIYFLFICIFQTLARFNSEWFFHFSTDFGGLSLNDLLTKTGVIMIVAKITKMTVE